MDTPAPAQPSLTPTAKRQSSNTITEAAKTNTTPYVVETYTLSGIDGSRRVESRSFYYDKDELAQRLSSELTRRAAVSPEKIDPDERISVHRTGKEPAAVEYIKADTLLLYKVPEISRALGKMPRTVTSEPLHTAQTRQEISALNQVEVSAKTKPQAEAGRSEELDVVAKLRHLDEHFHKRGSQYRFRQNMEVVAFTTESSMKGTVLKTTHHDNELVVKGMVDLAIAKGWTSLDVKGTPEFRHQVWLEATERGRSVKGYEPTLEDMERLKQRMDKNTVPTNTITRADTQRTPTVPESEPAAVVKRTELSGNVLEMGRAPYKNLKDEPINYYIKLAEKNGNVTTVWGKDLERAAKEVDLKVGDRIHSIAQDGKQPVTVQANVRDADNKVVGREAKESHLNRWVITKDEREAPNLTPIQAGLVKAASRHVPAEVREQVEAKTTERLLDMAKHGVTPKVEVYDPTVPSAVIREPRTLPQAPRERPQNIIR